MALVKGLFSRLVQGLSRTREGFVKKVESLFKGKSRIDEELYEELEALLIGADVGVEASMEIVGRLRERVAEEKVTDPSALTPILKEEIKRALGEEAVPLVEADHAPTVIMMVGVNGTGKTTTVAKLAHRFKSAGKKVVVGAADTFRAAAIDQLETWARRVGVDVVKHQEGADPAAVAYDAVASARARRADVVIIDTAGRLHTQSNLMEELKKIRRVLGKEDPTAPHEVLLVLDATTGQNAISQAKVFGGALGVTGIVLTKLDGTAKGGIVVAIRKQLGIPVKLIGSGEGMEDLRDFDPGEFVDALFAEAQ